MQVHRILAWKISKFVGQSSFFTSLSFVENAERAWLTVGSYFWIIMSSIRNPQKVRWQRCGNSIPSHTFVTHTTLHLEMKSDMCAHDTSILEVLIYITPLPHIRTFDIATFRGLQSNNLLFLWRQVKDCCMILDCKRFREVSGRATCLTQSSIQNGQDHFW